MDALANPARFSGRLHRTEHDLTALSDKAASGELKATPETLALVLRHTAGIVAALSAAVSS